MAKAQLSLYQSALGRLRVSRMAGMVVLVVDGQGLALAPALDFDVVEKWAKSKQAGPNATIDMGKMMEKLDVVICRPGTSFASTRGSLKPLEGLVKALKAAGMDAKEFQLPPELKDGYVSPEQKAKEAEARRAKIAAESEGNE
jgi:hypothetical protein